MSSTVITIDIGNSTITIGLFRDRVPELRRISLREITREGIKRVLEELVNPEEELKGAIISSVVPGKTSLVEEVVSGFTRRTLIINSDLNTGLVYGIKEPSKTGTDRIAAATGAYEEFKKPLVVADFGTATTLTVVSSGGLYLGGAILPGIDMGLRALKRDTACLPEVKPEKPKEAIGKETVSAINSGIIYGTAGAVERLKEEFERELGCALILVTTGGNAGFVEPFLRIPYYKRPYLVLEGLRLIFERNTCE